MPCVGFLPIIFLQATVIHVMARPYNAETKICECLAYGALDSDCVKSQKNSFLSAASPPQCYSDILQQITATNWLAVYENTGNTVHKRLLVMCTRRFAPELFTFVTVTRNADVTAISVNKLQCEQIVRNNMYSKTLWVEHQIFLNINILKHLHWLTNQSAFNFELVLVLQELIMCPVHISVQFDFKKMAVDFSKYTVERPCKYGLNLQEFFLLKENFELFNTYCQVGSVFVYKPAYVQGNPIDFSKYVIQSQPVPSRICPELKSLSNGYLNLISKRLFNNSTIQFTIRWEDYCLYDKQYEFKQYEFKCKIFDSAQKSYHSNACKMCYRNLTQCHSCMYEAYGKSYALPQVGTVTGIPCIKTFTIRTNLGLYTKTNGTLNWNQLPDIVNNTSDLIMLDWYLANTFSGATDTSIKNQVYYLNNSVVVPGPYSVPIAVPPARILKYFALCAVREHSFSTVAGPWTPVVKVQFDENTTQLMRVMGISGSNQVVLVEKELDMLWGELGQLVATQKTPIMFIGNSQNGVSYVIAEHNWRTWSSFQSEALGCYHYMLGCWYAISKSDQKLYLLMHCTTSGSTHFMQYRNLLSNKVMEIPNYISPKEIKCPEFHAYLVLSGIVNSSEISIFKLHLNPLTGEPIPSLVLLDNKELCKCSTTNSSISAPFIDIVYRELHSSINEPEIVVICNYTFCLHGPKYDKKLALISPNVSINEVYAISMDLYRLYIHCCMTINNTDQIQSLQHQENVLKYLKQGITPLDDEISLTYVRRIYHIFKKGKYIRLDKMQIFKEATDLPVPPVNCMFPETAAHISMIGHGIVRVQGNISWNMDRACQELAKPKVIFEVKYAVLTGYEAVGYNCFNGQVTCTSAKDSPSKLVTRKELIRPVRPTGKYYFEISAVPVFTDTLHTLWYSGIAPKVLTKVYNTTYAPTDTGTNAPNVKLLVTVVVSIIVFAATIIGILLLTIVWNRRKYYLYKSLKRLCIKDLNKQEKLAEGHFGEVWKATLYGTKEIVIKMLKESSTDLEEKEFREEALLMSKLRSECIVRPIGICLQCRPIMLALEFMNGGSVDKYLRREDVQSALRMQDLFLVVEHAASGCLYLENEGYIHRDLSARNLLVHTISCTNLKPKQVKITDFGLAKDTHGGIYNSRNPEKDILPIAWCAPESFCGRFSTKSDIWAFGVLMWEVFSWASTPYRLCSMNHHCSMLILQNEEVEDFVRRQKRNLSNLRHPCNALFSDTLCQLMEWCWAYDPDDRPHFCQLLNLLVKSKRKICSYSSTIGDDMHDNKPDLEYLQLSDPYTDCNNTSAVPIATVSTASMDIKNSSEHYLFTSKRPRSRIKIKRGCDVEYQRGTGESSSSSILAVPKQKLTLGTHPHLRLIPDAKRFLVKKYCLLTGKQPHDLYQAWMWCVADLKGNLDVGESNSSSTLAL